MKKPIQIIYKNGYKYRSHNKGFTVFENDKVFYMEFKNFVKEKNVISSKSFNIKGVAYTRISLSEESMEALVIGFIKYKEKQDQNTLNPTSKE